MNPYTSSPYNTVIDENNNPPPLIFHIWQQPILNPPMVRVPSQSVTPAVSQDHVQSNTPLFSRPSFNVCQPHYGQFSVQSNTGPEVHILPQRLPSAAVSQREMAQLNVPMPPRPPQHIYQETRPVQGDPSPAHVPSNVVSPIQTETPTDQKRHMCPYCKRKFKRYQELKRHLRSNLPDSMHCPFPLCPWTGRRQYSLKKHMEDTKIHPNPDPGRQYEQKGCQIYDPDELVQSMASGTMTVERAVGIALSKVKKRFEEQDKAGVETSVWGSRRKLCVARAPRSWS